MEKTQNPKGEKVEFGMFPLTDKEFHHLVDLIYEHTRIKMGDHKRALVSSRLGKRIRALHFEGFADYIAYLNKPDGEQEIINFVNAVTTNKTDFFRENKQFEFMQTTLLPAIKEKLARREKTKIRIWSAGCSTGEEPYSIMITLFEFFGLTAMKSLDIRMLASDIDTNVLARAEEGVYREDVVRPVSEPLLRRYFLKGKGENAGLYRVKDFVKPYIKFRQINLRHDTYPIHTKFDFIFCRNVIIYFDKEFQKSLFSRYYNYLHDDGFVFIGHSETLFGVSEKFKYVTNNIYRKV